MAKRSESSRSSILNATLHLLLEENMTVKQLSIEAIAREAGVGKTTIYRWWPSKAAVVIDAFVENHLLHTPVRTDIPVPEALERHLASLIGEYAGPPGRLVAQIIAECQYDPEIQDLFRKRFFDDRHHVVVELVQRGIDNGELSDKLEPEVFSEMLYAPVYHYLLFGHAPLNRKLAKALIHQALALGAAGPNFQPAKQRNTK